MRLPALITLLAATPAPPAPLAPTGPWLVESEPDSCILSHAYGSTAERVTVGFQPMLDQDHMDVIVITPSAKKTGQAIGDAILTPGPGGAQSKGDYSSVLVIGKPERFTRISTDQTLLAALPAAATLTIKAKPVDVIVRLGGFQKALAAFRTCQDGLLRSWGVDPATVDPEHAPRPVNIGRLFAPESYPGEAIRSGIIGRVVAVLNVDATGATTACRVVSSAGQVLNAGTCRQGMKVRFRPGTGLDGKPAASVYILPVRWLLP